MNVTCWVCGTESPLSLRVATTWMFHELKGIEFPECPDCQDEPEEDEDNA